MPSQPFARRGIFTGRERTIRIKGDLSAENHVFKSNKIVELYQLDGFGWGAEATGLISRDGGFYSSNWQLPGMVGESFNSIARLSEFTYVTEEVDNPPNPPYTQIVAYTQTWEVGYHYRGGTPVFDGDFYTTSVTATIPVEQYYEIIPGVPPQAWVDAVNSIVYSWTATDNFASTVSYSIGCREVFDPHRLDRNNTIPHARSADLFELPYSWSGTAGNDVSQMVRAQWTPVYGVVVPYFLQSAFSATYTPNLASPNLTPGNVVGPASQTITSHWYHVLPGGQPDPALPDLQIPVLSQAAWASSSSVPLPMGRTFSASVARVPLHSVEAKVKARQIQTGDPKPVSGVIVEAYCAPGNNGFDQDSGAIEASLAAPPTIYSVASQTISGTDPSATISCGGIQITYTTTNTYTGITFTGVVDSAGPRPAQKMLYVQARFPWEQYRDVSGMLKARLFRPWNALRLSQADKILFQPASPTILNRAQNFTLIPSAYGFFLCHKRFKVRFRSVNRANVPLKLTFLGSGPGRGIIVSPGVSRTYTATTGASGTWVERTIDITAFPPSASQTDTSRWDGIIWDSLQVQTPSDQPSPTWRIELEKIELLTDKGFATSLNPAPGLPTPGSSGPHGWPPLWTTGALHAAQGGWPSLHLARYVPPPLAAFQPAQKIRGAATTIREAIYEINRNLPSNLTHPLRQTHPYPQIDYGGEITAQIELMKYSGWSATDLAPPRPNKPRTLFGTWPSLGYDRPYDQRIGYWPGTYDSGGADLPWPWTDIYDSDAPIYALGGDGLIVDTGLGGPPGPLSPTPSSPELRFTLDTPTTGDGAAIEAQHVGQSIRVYPGAGDIGAKATDPGAFGPTIPIDFYCVSEGGVVGQIVGATDELGDVLVREIREHDGSAIVAIDPPRDVGAFKALPDGDGHARGTLPLRGDRPNTPFGPLWDSGIVSEVKAEEDKKYFPVDGWEVWPRHRERRWIRFWGEGLSGLSLLHGFSGFLLLATQSTGGDSGRIRIRRSEFPVPSSYALDELVTDGPGDAQPRLYRYPSARLGLMFSRSGEGVLDSYSDDDGATWSTPTMAFANASSPAARIDLSGTILRAAIVPEGDGYVVQATRQEPGAASPSDPWVLQRLVGSSLQDLRVEKKGFDFSPAPVGGAALVLVCVLEGDTDTSDLVSYDDGLSWKAI